MAVILVSGPNTGQRLDRDVGPYRSQFVQRMMDIVIATWLFPA